MAIAKKKAAKRRSKNTARKSRPGRAAKASAAKKRSTAKKRPAKKAKAAKRTSTTKSAPKKTKAKSSKKTKPAKRSFKSETPSVAKKSPATGAKSAKARTAKPSPVPTASTTSVENKFYITTAIAYPNGVPHIGHAYEAIATDALARFQRLDGKDVFFLTGTDEHGLKMAQTAELEKLPIMEVATRNAQRFKDMDERLDVSFDRFIRTTEEQHHRSSQEIWKRMADNGDIYLDSYAGWYSVRDEAYYAEDETVLDEDNVRRGPQGSPVEWVLALLARGRAHHR